MLILNSEIGGPTKLAVTGANGRLGINLCEKLRVEGSYNVTEITSLRAPSSSGTISLDVSNQRELSDALTIIKPDVIVHLAALIGRASEANPSRTRAINVTSTQTIAEYAANQSGVKLIFASTGGVYGDEVDLPRSETDHVAPGNEYTRSKIAAEEAIEVTANGGRTFTAISLRFFNLYGRSFDESLVSRLLGSSPLNPVRLNSMDEFARDYVHVDDAVAAILLGIKSVAPPGHTLVNIGSGLRTTNRMLVDELSRHGKIHYRIEESAPSFNFAAIKRAQTLLGWAPRTSIVDYLSSQLASRDPPRCS